MPINDQRATERFNCEAPVVLEDFQTGERHDGSMYNYSRGGMYIELDYRAGLPPEAGFQGPHFNRKW